MPIPISAPEPLPRRSGEDLSGSNVNPPTRPLVVETSNGYEFPDLEGKDQQQQVEFLVHALEVENRIKDGAENLLELHPNDLQEALRKQVDSELLAARKKIEAISKKLEEVRALTRGPRKKPSGLTLTSKAGPSYPAGRRRAVPLSSKKSREELGDSRDDFRTAMSHASTQIARLLSGSMQGNGSDSPRLASQASTSTLQGTTTPVDPQDSDRFRVDAMNTLVSIFKRNTRVRYEVDLLQLIYAVIPSLADIASKESRTAAYRLLRYALVDTEAVERFHEFELDWYILRTLSRDNKYHLEKEQAILLIRALVNIGNSIVERRAGAGCGSVPVSEPVMRAVVAIAEQTEDPFRGICLVTLTEILLLDTELMYRTGGIRVLIQAISDGPPELGPLFVTAFLFIIDAPRTRAYLRPEIDLENALSGITDAYGKGEEHAEKMKACSKIIQVMLRTWSGLMYLCMNDMLAIRATIDTLRIPSLQTREIILDMFFDLLNIKTPAWYQAFIAGRRLTYAAYGRGKPTNLSYRGQEVPIKPPERMNLTDQYIGLLLLVLVKAGLLDALIAIIEESTDPGLARKATLLMGEVLQIANKVLPLSVAAKIQTLPKLFDLAADYSNGPNRIIGTTTLSSLDSFNRNRTRLQSGDQKGVRPRANSVEESVRRGQRQVEQTKIKMGMQMDDKSFTNLLIETQVTMTKDQTKWNFEMITDLIEGPLLNPKRLEEAIRVSKWPKRLMMFYHPFNHRFSNLSKTKANARWVRLGSMFLLNLITTQEGQRFLTEDAFLGQIVDCFAQLDPSNGNPRDPIFSKQRLETTLTSGYLEMLGALSKHPEGIELLERFNIFTAFYHITELRGRDDLVKGIIQAIDYSIDGHARIVLSKALTSRYVDVRLYATEYVGQMIQASSKATSWTLRLLLTQLYDPAPEVCELAVRILEEACESADILELVVEMQPTLDHLGEIGDPLLLKFMSTPVGFRYLYQADYIEREMNTWFHERNYHYVVQIEVYLAKAFSANGLDEDDELLAFEGTVPPHFYGAMAKTEMGCRVLTEKGHFAEFAHFIRQHGLESEDFDLVLKLKSVLWAVGNIGATERGLPFMEDEDLIPTITDIARESPILSVRGTCFFVLGLISSTAPGAEVLDDYGWEATTCPLGNPTGFAIPVNVLEFVSVPPWNPPSTRDVLETRLPPPTNPIERDAITAIYNLGNNVIANAASRTLVRLKARPESRNIFSSIPLFYRALHTISTQRYRLPVRRYILDIFDIRLDAETIRALSTYGNIVASQPASTRREKGERPLTMIRTIKRSDDDDEGELDIDEGHGVNHATLDDYEVTSIRAKPLQTQIGFDA